MDSLIDVKNVAVRNIDSWGLMSLHAHLRPEGLDEHIQTVTTDRRDEEVAETKICQRVGECLRLFCIQQIGLGVGQSQRLVEKRRVEAGQFGTQ